MNPCTIHASNNTRSATNGTPFNRAVMHASKAIDLGDTYSFGGALYFEIVGDTVYVAGSDNRRLNLGSFPKDSEGIPSGLLDRVDGGSPWFQFKEKRTTSVLLDGRDYGAPLGWRKVVGMGPNEMSHPGVETCRAAEYPHIGQMKLSSDVLGNFMGELGRYCDRYLNHQFLMDVVGKGTLDVQAFVGNAALILLDETYYPDRPLIHCIAFRYNMDLLTLEDGTSEALA